MKTRSRTRKRLRNRIPLSWLKRFYTMMKIYPSEISKNYEVWVDISPSILSIVDFIKNYGVDSPTAMHIAYGLVEYPREVLEREYRHLIRRVKYMPGTRTDHLVITFELGTRKTLTTEQVEKIVEDAINKGLNKLWRDYRNYIKKR